NRACDSIAGRCAGRRRRSASDRLRAARASRRSSERFQASAQRARHNRGAGNLIDVAYKIVAFLITLGVLVVFHELGHFVVARWCGVKVLRFSVGFGRIIWSGRRGPDETEWALSAVPLGGYVKMVDEREGSVDPIDLPRAFNRQSVWKRMAIVAA